MNDLTAQRDSSVLSVLNNLYTANGREDRRIDKFLVEYSAVLELDDG